MFFAHIKTFDSTLVVMNELAKEFKGKSLFVYIDIDVPDHKNVVDYFGFKEDTFPIYIMFEVKLCLHRKT